MMRRKFSLNAPCVAAMIAFLCACTSPGLVRQHADLAAHCQSIRQVAVVPPNVEMYLVHIGGSKELLQDRMRSISSDLVSLIEAQVATHGFRPLSMDRITAPSGSSEQLFRDAEISRLYGTISGEMYGKPLSVAESRSIECKLGEEARNLASLAHSDGLIFLRFAGYRRTGASVASELAFKVLFSLGGVYAPQEATGAAQLEVALVDGKTGDVLWVNRVVRTKFGLTTPDFERDELTAMIRELFRAFPNR
jgi:hypothetical protein